jgi:hypothetical protein
MNAIKAFFIFRLYHLSHTNSSELVYEAVFALIADQSSAMMAGEILVFWGPAFFVVFRAIMNAIKRL